MRVESIGYLLSAKELAALMLLADVSRLPGIDLGIVSKEDIQEGLNLLEESGLIQGVEGAWIASRSISLVMRAMGLCDWFFSALNGGSRAAIYTGQGIFVSLRSCAGGRFVVTPFPDGERAWEDMLGFLPPEGIRCTLAWRYRIIRQFTGSKTEMAAWTYGELDRQAALGGRPEAGEDLWKA